MWISNNKKKGTVLAFLREKIPDVSVSTKDIYDENNFIETLNSLNEIRFTAVPEIFSKVNSPTNALEDEINLYEAREAELRLKYKNYTLMPSLIRKIKSLFKDKDKYKSIMISGRDRKDADILFDSSVFARNVKVWAYVDDNGMCFGGGISVTN